MNAGMGNMNSSLTFDLVFKRNGAIVVTRMIVQNQKNLIERRGICGTIKVFRRQEGALLSYYSTLWIICTRKKYC